MGLQDQRVCTIFSNPLFAGLKVFFLLALKFHMITPDIIKIGIRKAVQKEVKYMVKSRLPGHLN